MLVLSRRENERIRLGESIVVTIIRIGSEKVRLGIEAPPDVRVLRDELDAFDSSPVLAAPAAELTVDCPATIVTASP